ncbi:SNF2 family N-terminal domain-containing protein [Humidesulfovibrio mexicanus]|uniref:SNF2 family N-terminal domain-containing protein n=1 Tax=Humidesulfovibrio mexicanus TaxID=147047 RepID=A0A238XYH9_9BACT|nr:helicase-related protein [Humidesulfovibrio mexicanus]SNR64106.1 SNF2 family N-terminal domain-containing protein [Humidesulfovibrio mexicanus]
MSYAVGSLVKARNREWVVLPDSSDDLLVLRPLGGTDKEIAGVLPALEPVGPAQFALPDPGKPGDFITSRLLRDAVRLGFRSSAGPFRSFGKIAVEPRPYQLVPLLMALKLDPVRILVSDDVGIGKTVEASLIARELLDRGEIQRLAILCPPHLAEQWQGELREKFNIETVLILPSTARSLERHCRPGESLFERYPYSVVSLDYIKTDHRRDEFIRTCPELVIIDEAHTCAWGEDGRGVRHQRHRLVKDLAAKPDQHMVLVTATPHSGKDAAFRSLLSLLNPEFSNLPEDLAGPEQEQNRRKLAAHFVQRKRADIRHFLSTDTPFPDREERELQYRLSPNYKKLFDKVLEYARETVQAGQDEGRHRQRVRWWSVLGLLRSLASSPAAAAATLRSRASVADTESAEEADQLGRQTVLDLLDEEGGDALDVAPGSDVYVEDENSQVRRRLLQMAREAEALMGAEDQKLKTILTEVKKLLDEGFHPIVFCRFIPTADYVAEELRKKLTGVVVDSVTGMLPPAEREERVYDLSKAPKRVLVCTDCLSEGINLQEHFDAVIHYDLSWNPTRHEQREGRVDRFGQPKPVVRIMTYFGIDNQIDGFIIDILIKKHKTIKNDLGISVPVPVESDAVVQAIFEGLLLRGGAAQSQGQRSLFLPGMEELIKPKAEALYAEWENASKREKRTRTMFAQEAIKTDEVAKELDAMRSAIGSGVEVERFTREALQALGATVSVAGPRLSAELRGTPQALKDSLPISDTLKARFAMPVQDDEVYLHRTHNFVESLAAYVMDTALDPIQEGIAKRCGAIRTRAVTTRTTILMVRFRYHIITRKDGVETPLLAEDCRLLGFEGSPDAMVWIPEEQAEKLLLTMPDASVPPDMARSFLSPIIQGFDAIWPELETFARSRGEELLAAHRRVRTESRHKGVSYAIEPQLPPDVLGLYVFMPVPRQAGGAA